MGKSLYQITVPDGIIPASSANDAWEMCHLADHSDQNDFILKELVDEGLTAKLLMISRFMYQADRFEFTEVRAALMAILDNYPDLKQYAADVAEGVCQWTERILDDMDDEEFMDWMSQK